MKKCLYCGMINNKNRKKCWNCEKIIDELTAKQEDYLLEEAREKHYNK